MDNYIKSIMIVGEWGCETKSLVSILTSEGIRVVGDEQQDLVQSQFGCVAMFQDLGDEIRVGDQLKKIPKEVPKFALIDADEKQRAIVYRNDFFDYILRPVIKEELVRRINMAYLSAYGRCEPKTFVEKPASSIKDSQLCSELGVVNKATRILRDDLSEKHSFGALAKAIGTNRNKLASSFKSVIGKSVFEWLRLQRLERAKDLLAHTSMSVQNIGLEVGYGNSAHFSTLYSKHFNISPIQDRKKMIETKDPVTGNKGKASGWV
jgi:AraC-like DNA-binding protein